MKQQTGVIVAVLVSAALLTGCAGKRPVSRVINTSNMAVVKAATPTSSVASATLDEAARMERCRRELDVLKKINSAVYENRRGEFERMMSGAGVYSGVRGDVSTYTQEAVDAFYRFRAEKLCADIANDVLNELAKQ
ncbi:hypothetical protein DKG82_22730 [Salmonella enterica subsp. enterica serovar Lexington]|nr:hypothetical protein [Salmonella enterica]EAA0562662.1 hypothetical protein [Salmonella enterica subsp. enterica serovar Lexington]EBP3214355.1 hypothetical protein [Salmonella enterica subsp. arizonae]ECM3796606.1 hypothetical protein [Salmonella enterica subsp. enterica serovar Newport]EDR2773641.1 hypothetical protein [Salmonella enterica subsp. enterica serovar Oslo]EDV1074452.1 hypothetical protein [Salmonella enterica subsp. enterica]EDW0192257.1 hypothetical protein [Salmonella ente